MERSHAWKWTARRTHATTRAPHRVTTLTRIHRDLLVSAASAGLLLANMLRGRGEDTEAETLYRRAVDARNTNAMSNVAVEAEGQTEA